MAISDASKKSSKPNKTRPNKLPTTKTKEPKRGPFSSEIWDAATRAADEYQIIVNCEAGEWFGRGLELPHVFGNGATVDECVKSTREALAVALGYLLESGKVPPPPAQQGLRTEQVNVRLSVEEKALLECSARSQGYSGLSNFIRAAVLASVR